MDPAFDGLIGESRAFRKALITAELAARTDCPVLISGETGTGKELVARAIHAASCRRSKPLVIVSCPAIPPSLAESELFGHERGAFTGATTTSAGRFGSAHGGSIVLDEIDDLSSQMQAKLLRAVETGDIKRLGLSRSRKLDVRAIATTSCDLRAEVQSGKFRADLFYRLNVVHITLPPLRRREDDVIILAVHFLDRFNKMHGKSVTGLGQEAVKLLWSYHWPGNVRELEHAVERAVLVRGSGMVIADDLGVFGENRAQGKRRRGKDEMRSIRDALSKNGGNVSATARVLGLSRGGLIYILKRSGIDAQEFRARHQ